MKFPFRGIVFDADESYNWWQSRGHAMQQTLQCPRCGTSNYWGQPYCVGCGSPMSATCPRCGNWMPSASGFCTNCGAQFGQTPVQPPFQPPYQPPVQQVKQHKPMSGWAKFGTFLFVLGVLCIVIGPVLIMLRPDADQSTSLLIKVVGGGGLGLLIGLPLMFKG
jgi:predicted amidophosphoribosyltransferase